MTITRNISGASSKTKFVKGILHSTDASAGVAVPIFVEGTTSAYTLASDEYIVVEAISLVTAPGGDTTAFFSTDGSIDTGETIARGTFAVSSGIAFQDIYAPGAKGASVYAKAPAGVLDVVFYGQVRKA